MISSNECREHLLHDEIDILIDIVSDIMEKQTYQPFSDKGKKFFYYFENYY